jgi:type IV secretory pathway VirB10-like protein
MKQVLSIFIVALLMSACQSPTAKNENANFPSSDVTPVTSSEPSAFSPEMPTHNPAHGQPYHDCALPVGAPLVVNEPTVAQPEALKEEVKLNPEHGLPGHRCDLAVGAPLT